MAILFLCGFGAALVSTFCIWYDRSQTTVVISALSGNKIVMIAVDIFRFQRSRSELVKLCNLGTCDVVIMASSR
jgi:hypothetical protein